MILEVTLKKLHLSQGTYSGKANVRLSAGSATAEIGHKPLIRQGIASFYDEKLQLRVLDHSPVKLTVSNIRMDEREIATFVVDCKQLTEQTLQSSSQQKQTGVRLVYDIRLRQESVQQEEFQEQHHVPTKQQADTQPIKITQQYRLVQKSQIQQASIKKNVTQSSYQKDQIAEEVAGLSEFYDRKEEVKEKIHFQLKEEETPPQEVHIQSKKFFKVSYRPATIDLPQKIKHQTDFPVPHAQQPQWLQKAQKHQYPPYIQLAPQIKQAPYVQQVEQKPQQKKQISPMYYNIQKDLTIVQEKSKNTQQFQLYKSYTKEVPCLNTPKPRSPRLSHTLHQPKIAPTYQKVRQDFPVENAAFSTHNNLNSGHQQPKQNQNLQKLELVFHEKSTQQEQQNDFYRLQPLEEGISEVQVQYNFKQQKACQQSIIIPIPATQQQRKIDVSPQQQVEVQYYQPEVDVSQQQIEEPDSCKNDFPFKQAQRQQVQLKNDQKQQFQLKNDAVFSYEKRKNEVIPFSQTQIYQHYQSTDQLRQLIQDRQLNVKTQSQPYRSENKQSQTHMDVEKQYKQGEQRNTQLDIQKYGQIKQKVQQQNKFKQRSVRSSSKKHAYTLSQTPQWKFAQTADTISQPKQEAKPPPPAIKSSNKKLRSLQYRIEKLSDSKTSGSVIWLLPLLAMLAAFSLPFIYT